MNAMQRTAARVRKVTGKDSDYAVAVMWEVSPNHYAQALRRNAVGSKFVDLMAEALGEKTSALRAQLTKEKRLDEGQQPDFFRQAGAATLSAYIWVISSLSSAYALVGLYIMLIKQCT
jgi:hypothetical protein